MTGFVLHPGHHELHGITVVVETVGPLTYVARFDKGASIEIARSGRQRRPKMGH